MARRGDTCVCFRLWACVKIRALVFTSLPQVHFSSFSRIRNSKVCFNSLCDSSFVWGEITLPVSQLISLPLSLFAEMNYRFTKSPRVFACGSNNRCVHRSGTFPSGFLLPRSLHQFILRCLLTIFTPSSSCLAIGFSCDYLTMLISQLLYYFFNVEGTENLLL